MNRDNSLDAVGGLLIAYMIYGHICLWCGVKHIEILTRLFFFFMPGSFLRAECFSSQKRFVTFFQKAGGG